MAISELSSCWGLSKVTSSEANSEAFSRFGSQVWVIG